VRSREVECGAVEEEGKEWDGEERAGAEISGKRGFWGVKNSMEFFK